MDVHQSPVYDSFNLSKVRNEMRVGKVTFRVHAIRRMFERGVTEEDVRLVLRNGEVIGDYPDDTPYPSCLMLGWCNDRPVHVVAASNHDEKETIVVTVYEPDPAKWDTAFRSKRK